MKILPFITVPSAGFSAATASLPPEGVILCVVAALTLSVLPELISTVFAYLTERRRAQSDDDFRRALLGTVVSVPRQDRAGVCVELARTVGRHDSTDPPASGPPVRPGGHAEPAPNSRESGRA